MKEKITEEQFFNSGKVIKNGVEYPESTPVELPIGYSHPPDIHTLLRTMVRQELEMREEMDPEFETDREEDFDLDEEEEELLTPGELHYAAAQEKEALVRQGLHERKKKSRALVDEGAKAAVDLVKSSDKANDAAGKGDVVERLADGVVGQSEKVVK